MMIAQDYFALFQLERRFTIDVEDLGSRYLRLQNRFHPDRFVNQSAQQQQIAAEASANLNIGYRTLKSSLSRSIHLLSLHNDNQALNETINDSELLMLQMQRNECLENAEDETDLQTLADQVHEDVALTESGLADVFSHNTLSKDQLASALSFVQRLQFLMRLLESIEHKRHK